MESGLTCRTFCNRLRCYYFNPKNNYLKQIDLLFKSVLKKYKNTNNDLIKLFSETFSNKRFTGLNKIYNDDKFEVKEYCITSVININNFINKYNVTNILDTYNYKFKIKGYIGGIIDNLNYNVWFDFRKFDDLLKDLDFVCLNNYIYNITHKKNRDCIAMSVPDNIFYKIKFNITDYTINNGYFTSMKKNKLRIRGDHCLNCENNCKPIIINGLDRLDILI